MRKKEDQSLIGKDYPEIWKHIRERYNEPARSIVDLHLAGKDRTEIMATLNVTNQLVGMMTARVNVTLRRIQGDLPPETQKGKAKKPKIDEVDHEIWYRIKDRYDEQSQSIVGAILGGEAIHEVAARFGVTTRQAIGTYAGIKKSIGRIKSGEFLFGVKLSRTGGGDPEFETIPPLVDQSEGVKATEAIEDDPKDEGIPETASPTNKLKMRLVISPAKPGGTECWHLSHQIDTLDGYHVPNDLVQFAFEQLSHFHQRILLMRHNDNLSERVIASKLELGEGTVTSALQKARINIAELVMDMPQYEDARTASKIGAALAGTAPPTPFQTERKLNEMIDQGTYPATDVNRYILDVLWTMGGKKEGKLMTSVDLIFQLAKERHPGIRRGQVEAALRTLRIRSVFECKGDVLDGNYILTTETVRAVLGKQPIPGVAAPEVNLNHRTPEPPKQEAAPPPAEQKELAMTPLPSTTALVTTAADAGLATYIESQFAVLAAAGEAVSLRSRNQTLEMELIKARDNGIELDQDDLKAVKNALDFLQTITGIVIEGTMGAEMLKMLLKEATPSRSSLEEMQVTLLSVYDQAKSKF